MEKQSYSESILADWCWRRNVSQHCYDLANELGSYFAGFEDLQRRLVLASFTLKDLADDILPFDLSDDTYGA